MAIPSRTKGSVSTVTGLTESINALKKVNPQLKAEAIDVLRTGAKAVQSNAQSKIGNHPAYRLPRNRGMIGRTATPKGAGVKLRAVKYPWALSGEFGEVWLNIPVFRGEGKSGDTKYRTQSRLKRRIAAPLKPPTSNDLLKNKGGYWIQPAIRKIGPQVTAKISKDLTKVFAKALKQSGVNTRG